MFDVLGGVKQADEKQRQLRWRVRRQHWRIPQPAYGGVELRSVKEAQEMKTSKKTWPCREQRTAGQNQRRCVAIDEVFLSRGMTSIGSVGLGDWFPQARSRMRRCCLYTHDTTRIPEGQVYQF